MEVGSLEVKVEESPEEDRQSLVQLLQYFPHMEVESWGDKKIRNATQIFEMFLVSGLDATSATNKIVELFSPPRVTKRLEQLKIDGLSIGTTFDLRPNQNGDSYDLTQSKVRAQVRSIWRTEKPYLVIGSPPCTEYTQMQTNWNHWRMEPAEVKRRAIQA